MPEMGATTEVYDRFSSASRTAACRDPVDLATEEGAHRARAPLEVAAALHRTEGAVGFVRGWRAHTPVESCGRAVYFCSYDVVKSACMAVGAWANLIAPREHGVPPPSQPETPLGVRILAGGIAGGLGWLTVYPLDVIKARMMSQPPGAATCANPWVSLPPSISC